MFTRRNLIFFTTTLLLTSAVGITYAARFVVKGGTNISILYNVGKTSFPKGCVVSPINNMCCTFPGPNRGRTFTLPGGSFNISSLGCGSSGHAQAEFTFAGSGVIVDASIVQSSSPQVQIIPSSGDPINSSNRSGCGVWPPGGSPTLCQVVPVPTPARNLQCMRTNNYCSNLYPTGTSYTIIFGG